MPQLDKVTFLSQFFWLSFFYLGFYFLIFKFFLPKMSRILKFRKKKMSGSQNDTNFLVSEKEQVRSDFDGMVTMCLNTSKNLFANTYERTENWLNIIRYDTNKAHYQRINKTYLQFVGESSLAENLALTQASSNLSEKVITLLLFSKIQL